MWVLWEAEVGGVDEDVVEVDDDERVQEGAKDVVHERHEGGWGDGGEAKRHDSVLEMAIPGSEGCLGNFGLRDADLMVARAEVEFCDTLWRHVAGRWTSSSLGRGYRFLMVALLRAR